MIKTLTFMFAILFGANLLAQEKLEPSDPRFNFKDGIYFTLQNYKDNVSTPENRTG